MQVANCTQARPVVCGLARVAHGKVIPVRRPKYTHAD